ncbi:MAG: SDR family NAD(P)-dependent oxidoreductase, partial [Stellaceae bacterium]
MAEPPFALNGRLALVTGAARGLGFAMAASLARAGAQVLLNGRDEARLARAVEALRAERLAAAPLAFDVADDAAVGR